MELDPRFRLITARGWGDSESAGLGTVSYT